MTTGKIYANGVDVSSLASIRTIDLAALLRVPAARTEDVELPDLDGVLPVPDKRSESNELVLPMWVHGCLSDGSVPSGAAWQTFHENVDELIDVFGEPRVELDFERPDGSVRRIVGEVIEVVDWTTDRLYAAGKVSVALHAADPFWSDVDPVTASVVSGGDVTVDLAEFAGANARMVELLVEFTAVGTVPNPRVEQVDLPAGRVGHFLTYLDTLTDESVEIDSALWETTGEFERIEHTDTTARYFVLAPQRPAPRVRVSHTGAGELTTTITGRRRFKTG